MKWKMTVNIKPLIGEDISEEGAKLAGDRICALLSCKLLALAYGLMPNIENLPSTPSEELGVT